jgi:hypothetical protein
VLAQRGLPVPLQLHIEPEFASLMNPVLPNGRNIRAGNEYNGVSKRTAH